MLICNSLNLFHSPIVGCSQWCDRHWAGWRPSSLRLVREGEFVFWHHLSTEAKMVWCVETPRVAGGKRAENERSAATGGEWVDEGCGHTCRCTWSGGHAVGTQRWGSYTRHWGEGPMKPCTWQSTALHTRGAVPSPRLMERWPPRPC